ncbi:hypothetical protein ACFX1Q_039647 [Malus domestica]
MEIPKSIPDFLLVEIEERCTRDVFTYAFEPVCIVIKKGAKSLKWTESGIPRKYVLSLKQIFAAKAELMEIAHHEQQNGHLLSSKDLQDNGIHNSFEFIQSTNSQLILALFSASQFFGYIQHTTISIHISLFDILLGEICQHLHILNALGFNLDSKD